MSGNRSALVLGAVCVFQAGLLAGQWGLSDAHAEEPQPADATADPVAEADTADEVWHGSPPMLCKAFQLDTKDPTVDTTNPKSDLGAWVSDREGEGWVMHGVDMEFAQKSTGYPMAWAQVCLYQPI